MSGESLHASAQHGRVDRVRAHLDAGVDANERDEEGVTALHWAAINGHDDCCRLLLARGADVHATGGALHATPLHWCTRQGHVQIMALLLDHGADPLLLDSQGFHALHLATHSSLVMALVCLLQRDEFQPQAALDRRDRQGHTSLMWAAFQGDALSVDVLLQHGASVHLADMDGLTALHWAVVHGNRACIERLVEAGSDTSAREHKGQTPAGLARELGSWPAYQAAVASVRARSRRPVRTLVAFVAPTVLYGAMFQAAARVPWVLAPLVLVLGIVGTHLLTTGFLWRLAHAKALQTSPYFASLLCMIVAHGIVYYASYLSRASALCDAVMLVCVPALLSLWVVCATRAPGACAKERDVRRTVHELAREGKLTGQYFCASCMSRRPLRAKHCVLCRTCVARHDHHCPWIMNCVGLENHVPFLLLLVSAVLAMAAFERAAWTYMLRTMPPTCAGPWVCHAALFYVTVMILIAAVWCLLLLAGQVYHVSTQVTSFELINLRRHGHMGGRPDAHMLGQGQAGYIQTQREQLLAQGLSPKEAQRALWGRGTPPRSTHWLSSVCPGMLGAPWLARQDMAASNPFDRGCLGNWLSFVSRGQYDRIDYTCLYDVA